MIERQARWFYVNKDKFGDDDLEFAESMSTLPNGKKISNQERFDFVKDMMIENGLL